MEHASYRPGGSRRKRRRCRPNSCCRRHRHYCRLALWLELMVGIIMTILGLFILLLSVESLKEGDYPALYFCLLFILLGTALLLVYYVHYYGLKCWIKRQVQRLDASIRSDKDALSALAKRSFNFSGIAGPLPMRRLQRLPQEQELVRAAAEVDNEEEGPGQVPDDCVVWEVRQSLV